MTAAAAKSDSVRIKTIPLKDRLIVALDVPTVAHAEKIVAGLGEAVGFYKIGMQLQFAGQAANSRAEAEAILAEVGTALG